MALTGQNPWQRLNLQMEFGKNHTSFPSQPAKQMTTKCTNSTTRATNQDGTQSLTNLTYLTLKKRKDEEPWLEKTKLSGKQEPFLASSVPNLGLDDLAIDVQGPSRELDANGGLGLEVEFVLGESREQIRLANTRVPDQDHLKEVIVVVVSSVPRHCWLA